MGNMSYCRFRNTVGDLVDCDDALDELLSGGAQEPLSRDELEAAKSLVAKCMEIAGRVLEAHGDPAHSDLSDALDEFVRAGRHGEVLDEAQDAAREAAEEAEAEEDDDVPA